jgi:hypothetical protein
MQRGQVPSRFTRQTADGSTNDRNVRMADAHFTAPIVAMLDPKLPQVMIKMLVHQYRPLPAG